MWKSSKSLRQKQDNSKKGHVPLIYVSLEFFPQLSNCMPDVWPTASIEIDFNVGCNGLVEYVRIVKDDGLDFTIQDCIEDAFQYAEFPAHDLPDGMDFSYPIEFAPG